MKKIVFFGILFFPVFFLQAVKEDPVVVRFRDECRKYNLSCRWITDYFYTMTVDQFIQTWPFVADSLLSDNFAWDYFAQKNSNKELLVSRIAELMFYSKRFFEEAYVDLETKKLVSFSIVTEKRLQSVVLLEKFCITHYSLFWVQLQDKFYAKTIDQLLYQFDKIVTRTDGLFINLVLISEILFTANLLVKLIQNPLLRNKYECSLELNKRIEKRNTIHHLNNERIYGN
jgi:hypothetical protein